jgi:hypothetical protein
MLNQTSIILLLTILIGCNIPKVATDTHYYSQLPVKDAWRWDGYLYFVNDSTFNRNISYSTSVYVTYGNYIITNDTIVLISNPKLKDSRNALYYYEDTLYAKIINRNQILIKNDTIYKRRKRGFGIHKDFPHKPEY